MGVFEKLKNALFEEEIVEVEEKHKKPKTKDFFKDRKVEKPIAKKVVLPEKREHKIEELDDEELLDEDFEIQPVRKEEKVESQTNFDITEDDFKVDEEDTYPEVVEEKPFVEERFEREVPKEEPRYYQSKPVEKVPYGMSSNTKIGVSEYGGAYEKKDSRTHFTPSPIISPIYGILDKNYKKEDVVQKKEVRLTSSYSRTNLNLDDVRKKAYGTVSDDLERAFDEPMIQKAEHPFKLEEKDVVNLLVDLSEDEKPSVKELTLGDALEYFNDLGLEYNVDYVDASKEVATGRRVRDNYDEDSQEEVQEKSNTRVSRLDEAKEDVSIKEEIDSDDNLFDLIDSMYKENE